MEHLGISFRLENRPALDEGFVPFGAWRSAYLAKAEHPVRIAIERPDGMRAAFALHLRGGAYGAANLHFLERMVKLLLWCVGGSRVLICGCDDLTAQLQRIYSPDGARAFDAQFMETVFQRPFRLEAVAERDFPAPYGQGRALGGHLNGCRIGFDAGGSDRKVSAVMDGRVLYSEEVIWQPKLERDPEYHFQEVLAALRTAAAHLPRVDAIGVSTAGVLVGNAPMVSSLFRSVPQELLPLTRTIFDRAAEAMGGVPLVAANDGDVTALAGAMQLHDGCVLGIAMGTSQAGGYVDGGGRLPGWFNELAFAPVDLSPRAAVDEWSGDRGVGGQYFSQEAVIRLATAAGIALDDAMTPAEKLAAVQRRAEAGDERALAVFRDIGTYLGHTLPLYAAIYELRHVLVLGRVASGAGGEVLVEQCRRVLAEEYSELVKEYPTSAQESPTLMENSPMSMGKPTMSAGLSITLPDEAFRRVGQSVAAAGLPVVEG